MMQNLKTWAFRQLPASLIVRLKDREMSELTDAIRSIRIVDSSPLKIGGSPFRVVTLEQGTQIIGHLPTKLQIKLIGHLAAEKGLTADYSKVLVDVVTRFMYSHMSTPLATLKHPTNERFMFHPQHRNLVQEDETIPLEIRQTIKTNFTPKPGWRVLDIGAFLGHGALWMRSQIGESGRIVCVEASQRNFQILNKSIELNGIQNVVAKHAAIWHTAGETIEFKITHQQRNAIDAEVVAGDESVSTVTASIPSLAEALGGVPDLVSLTVNGAEIEAIEGLKNVPADLLPRRIIAPGWYLKQGEPRSRILLELLRDLSYECCETRGHFVVAWR